VYFQIGGVWRVHPDGTGKERITGGVSPDPSPDGSRVVFQGSSSGSATPIVIRTLATGMESVLEGDGHYPRWSPAGDRVAFWRPSGTYPNVYAGEIVVANADGSGVRVVSAAGRLYTDDAIDWSPDGQWLVAHPFDDWDAYDPLDLIHVATGRTLPLAYSSGYTLACWKR
jgi:Tol biopolymer transport system component